MEGFDLTYPITLIEAIAESVIDYCDRSSMNGFAEGDARYGPTQHIHDARIAFREAPDEFAAKERTVRCKLSAVPVTSVSAASMVA